jgi:1-phosphatidylinositol-3-phosphate 5-kinase
LDISSCIDDSGRLLVSIMSSHDSPRTSTGQLSIIPIGLRSRRTSLASNSAYTQVDKDQLAQALDKIHSTASHSDSLTTFNEFASPPPASAHPESKSIASDLVQNGLSGLYSRFRGAVTGTKDKNGPTTSKGDQDTIDNISVKSQTTPTPTPKSSAPPTREDSSILASPLQISGSSSRLQSPTASSFANLSSEAQSQLLRSSKASIISTAATTPATTKSTTSSRPSMTQLSKATASSAVVPSLAPVNVSAFKDSDGSQLVTELSKLDTAPAGAIGGAHEHAANFVFGESRQSRLGDNEASVIDDSDASDDGTRRERIGRPRESLTREFSGGDGSLEMKRTTRSKRASSALSSLRAAESTRGSSSSRPAFPEGAKRPAAIERITQSHLPGYQASRASSTDRSTAETSPINTSAHNSVRHDSFSVAEGPRIGYLGRLRIPGTTINEGAPEAVSARLEQMRKQVLSKEFWMADEICKECFFCGDTFSAFRRKHHCRTCGCIFDSKCTSIISGQRFGVQGSLRVCKTCLDIINRRHDSSGSEDSADESALPTFFHSQQAKFDAARNETAETNVDVGSEMVDVEDLSRPLATPMMAIPATRRIGDSTNRRSAVLEIDAIPQLSRPSSSRSLKALSAAGRPASSGHKRHHSKHNFLGRFKSTAEERAPFHRGMTEEWNKKSRLPAFHDDNIIDPDLAPYMSDEGSSADEQMSIFATMNSASVLSPPFENDRSGFGSLLSASKRHRARTGEKSISGLSFTSRGPDEAVIIGSLGNMSRSNRRRNLSAASNSLHHPRSSARPPLPGFGHLDEEIASMEGQSTPGPSRMTRSASMRDAKAPAVELNNASLHHVRRLLHQLLEDANIPNVSSWEKALIPILLQCTDDVNPDVRHGDDIDIRHYVKLKKIPGGKPGDTAYVSGVVFTKNLALKSMARSISNPRIVIVSFPIEYSRHQHHFMSLEPVIAQEKEFLRNMVNRIASLRPQLLLVQKHISGLALQYLAEANIAVAYNVKPSVIEAVSRCAQTEIISSIDMVALKPVHIGKSAGFDVKTYVHKDIPGKKKTYIYLSGCPKEVGCTIVLRGANMEILSKMKRITEFMVYVVYNLKLETCLMRDEFVLIPSAADNSGSMSPSKQVAQVEQSEQAKTSNSMDLDGSVLAANENLPSDAQASQSHNSEIPVGDSEEPSQHSTADDLSQVAQISSSKDEISQTLATPKLVSAHQSHAHGSHEDHLPEDVPAPTFYSDMVAKHQTKILSASPFVKFVQPYLLMKAREQERKVTYYKGLRDQDTFEEQSETEKLKTQNFQLILPEMLHEKVTRAPRTLMEAVHAAHDAEYDKALHNYQTQKRQWENYIQGNINLFDPYAHQNITVLYTVVCTATTIPCAGPELLALAFYNEHAEFDPDCTLGQYVEDLCLSVNTICTSNGCERKMSEHHRTYVHGEARITIFVEKSPCKIKGLHDSILMWSYCKICQKETQVMPMSESTWKYSLGKYLELSFWSSELRLRAGVCPHDIHRDHLRYFGYRNVAIRIHYDPIDLLEIIVPRTRITWKVDNDVTLKNDLFNKIEERWNRFMTSVNSRIQGINTDSVEPEKAEACKAEVERLTKRAQEEHVAMTRKLQEKYVDSKYYEIIPLNRAVRAMQEKVTEWDDAFANFDANFFPSEKDIRRLAALQLKKMFIDSDQSTTSIVPTDSGDITSDVDEKSPNASLELSRNPSDVSAEETHDVLTSVVEEIPPLPLEGPEGDPTHPQIPAGPLETLDLDREGIGHLDLAYPRQSDSDQPGPSETPISTEISSSMASLDSVSPTPPLSTSPLDATLAEKVEKLQRTNQTDSGDSGSTQPESSSIPRPSERGASRRSGTATSPSLNRTQSQPAGTIRRLHPGLRAQIKHEKQLASDSSVPSSEGVKTSTEPPKLADKKLSERLGLGTLKGHRKAGGHSLIPRSVHSKRKEPKVSVSTLAKHFEQLSREFEKERMRDRKRRETKVTQSRAFPKASSKPIVEVYKDVNEAVEEHGPTDEDLLAAQPSHPDIEQSSVNRGLTALNTDATAGDSGPHSPTDAALTADETATEAETDDNQHNVSQTGSDDDGGMSDADHSLLDDIPSASEIAEQFSGKPNADLPMEIPKHEKSSLMKMLTNFWAERSASGWTPLDYPIGSGDHIFADVDVIVREDEPSSLIAFTLQTQDYRDKLADIRNNGETSIRGEERPMSPNDTPHDICEDGMNQAEVETSLLRATGTHLAYSFIDGSARMQCKIFYAEQFDAVRRKCGVADRIVESLSRCLKWDSKGGKTKSVFLKTLDDRLVLKSLSPIETAAFLKFAPAYFNIMAEALFHDLPTVIAKMLGFYQIIIKNPVTGTEIKWDVLVMENLFYDRTPTRIFDLKGSMRNRKIQSTGEQNEVLLDENMVEFIYESPLFAREVC